MPKHTTLAHLKYMAWQALHLGCAHTHCTTSQLLGLTRLIFETCTQLHHCISDTRPDKPCIWQGHTAVAPQPLQCEAWQTAHLRGLHTNISTTSQTWGLSNLISGRSTHKCQHDLSNVRLVKPHIWQVYTHTPPQPLKCEALGRCTHKVAPQPLKYMACWASHLRGMCSSSSSTSQVCGLSSLAFERAMHTSSSTTSQMHSSLSLTLKRYMQQHQHHNQWPLACSCM